MLNRLFTARRLTLFLVLAGASLCWSTSSEAAQEQRCQELGANCVCSERLESQSWTAAGGGFYLGAPLDPNDKPCGNSNGRHGIFSSSATPQTTTGLNGFVAWRDPSTTTGTSSVYATASQVNALSGRVAARYYIKLGTGYQSTGQGSCTNDKYIKLGDYFTAFGSGFTSSNAGNFPGNQAPGHYINKWIRIEMVVDRKSSPSRMWFYLKNVTDNTQEISFNVPTRLANDPNWVTDIIHKYRQDTCLGSADMMYAMLAHWPSPNGAERIGAAQELEGGGPPSNLTPPSAPTGLTVR